ncbi:HAD-IA family hydrolase [Pinisolibacter sp.]|uniref:HAD-IA family hydrolase n=1 Tax=Pinisolibacter sp. TaxID=2172024 RepID=UPI002FDCB9B5
MVLRALIFDVDGTLAETEEIHRDAFNRAFAEDGLSWHWDVDLYRDLLRVTGGKERIRRYLEMDGVAPALDDARIARLHARKNEIYGETVRSGRCALRPGVAELVRAARAGGLRTAISTTTSRPNVEALLAATFPGAEPDLFDPIVAGEDVVAKKPAPDAYILAIEKLGLPAEACLALEDSRNGLTAARAAGLATVVTPSLYTAHETFEGAAQVIPDLTAFDLEAW